MAEERASLRKPAVAERRPAVASPTHPVAAPVHAMPVGRILQQRIGNGGTQAFAAQVLARSSAPGMASTSGVGTGQLSLSQPGDAHEREADGIPTMAGASPNLTKYTTATVARDGDSPPPSEVPAAVVTALHTQHGRPLPNGEGWSKRVGLDVGHARLVEGREAAAAASSIRARAFTVGDRVFFGAGYDASTDGGELLHHELVHVAQQDGAEIGDPSSLSFTDPSGAFEREARRGAASSSGPPTIARDEEQDVPAATYFATFSERIGDEVVRFLGEQPLDTGTPYLKIPPPGLLGPTLVGPGGRQLANNLASFLSPLRVDVLVDKGRKKGRVMVTDEKTTWVEEKWTEGPDAWFADVAVELGQALTGKLHESLRRIVPRYIDAAVAVGMEAEQREARSILEPPSPTAADVIASHPIDHAVIAGLCAKAKFDYHGFRTAHPEALGKRGLLRPITFCWEAPRESTFWIRVIAPADPTVEEVANALFGASTHAGKIAVAAAPLFGFTGAYQLLQRHQDFLASMGANINQLGDPLTQAQKGPLADEIAKNQSAGASTSVLGKGDALRLLDENVAIVSKIKASAMR